jgi:hypothetical protein
MEEARKEATAATQFHEDQAKEPREKYEPGNLVWVLSTNFKTK